MMRASDYRKTTVSASDPATWPAWVDDHTWAPTPGPDADDRHFSPIPGDPWDVEGDPSTWPADTDADVWATTDPADFLAWVDQADDAEPLDADDAAEELGHLLRQREACKDLPLTLALLDAHITRARERAGLAGVPSADDEVYAARTAHDGPITDADHIIAFGHV
jgi:hypothetical protein